MKKKRFWKKTGLTLLILFAIMMIYAVLGLKETTVMAIDGVDLSLIADGIHIGSYDNFRWTNKVEITVKDHRIVSIRSIKAQEGREAINKELTDRIISQQRNDVDAVSGATASSNGFLKAVENGLKKAAKQP